MPEVTYHEKRIRKWISNLKKDDEFTAKDVAWDLKLTPVEVGGILKFQDRKIIYIDRRNKRSGCIWKRGEGNYEQETPKTAARA